MTTDSPPLKVPFTAQQLVLLEKVVAEGTHGPTVEAVCLALYREYTLQLFGKDGE